MTMFSRSAAPREELRRNEMFAEALEVLLAGLTTDRLTHHGKHYQYENAPIEIRPYQQPHPPLWYGAPNADAIAWAAPHGMNVVSLGPGARARAISDRVVGGLPAKAAAHASTTCPVGVSIERDRP